MSFSEDLSSFKHANRLLFSAAGTWLAMDNGIPLFSWDLNEAIKTGHAHGVDRADIYGCLLYVKAQFMEFARRCERFHIDIHISQFDARVASELL
ncbi:hypothetical protein D9757_003748 [Collybiopsis confluens]|uniref:Uncharacterized protein n=1 Tax=Collybiopsis confluens TaxID=2823264 RepID=A0A8H5MDH6_9AGAR|nr:hypothetical protein D9757_003748 [Collybiopsis confluens]